MLLAGLVASYQKNLGADGDNGAAITSDAFLLKNLENQQHMGVLRDSLINKLYLYRGLDTIQAAILNMKLNSISKWIKSRKKGC